MERSEATAALLGLISEGGMVPDANAENGHAIEIFGKLGAIWGLVEPKNVETRRFTGGASYSMVAGDPVGL